MPKRLYPPKSSKKVYPAIGIMKSSGSKYSMVTSVTAAGVTIRVNGHTIKLDMAPKDKNGVVEVLELRGDNMIWASGVRYFDPSTGEYFPGKQEEEEEEEEGKKKDPPPPDCGWKRVQRGKTRNRRRKPSGRIMVNSVDTVMPGAHVNIF